MGSRLCSWDAITYCSTSCGPKITVGRIAVLSVSSVLLPLGDRESQLSSFSPLLLWHSLAFSPLLMQFAAATGSVIARGKEKVLSSVQPFSS